MSISVHVDSSTGTPAAGVEIKLQSFHSWTVTDSGLDIFQPLATGRTNAQGRCNDLLPSDHPKLKKGDIYKLILETKEYFEGTGRTCFHPWIDITFEVGNPDENYHIPLIISPYGFTTYRGS